MAIAALRVCIKSIKNSSLLIDGASQFEDDETIAEIILIRAVALAPGDVRVWEDLAALYVLHDPAARRRRTRKALRKVRGWTLTVSTACASCCACCSGGVRTGTPNTWPGRSCTATPYVSRR